MVGLSMVCWYVGCHNEVHEVWAWKKWERLRLGEGMLYVVGNGVTCTILVMWYARLRTGD